MAQVGVGRRVEPRQEADPDRLPDLRQVEGPGGEVGVACVMRQILAMTARQIVESPYREAFLQ